VGLTGSGDKRVIEKSGILSRKFPSLCTLYVKSEKDFIECARRMKEAVSEVSKKLELSESDAQRLHSLFSDTLEYAENYQSYHRGTRKYIDAIMRDICDTKNTIVDYLSIGFSDDQKEEELKKFIPKLIKKLKKSFSLGGDEIATLGVKPEELERKLKNALSIVDQKQEVIYVDELGNTLAKTTIESDEAIELKKKFAEAIILLDFEIERLRAWEERLEKSGMIVTTYKKITKRILEKYYGSYAQGAQGA